MKYDFLITEELKPTFNSEDLGNGCGSQLPSRVICWLMMLPFNAEERKVLLQCFGIHDQEYGIDTSLKSQSHRLDADTNLEENLALAVKGTKVNDYGIRFAKRVHAGLVLLGNKAYIREED
jgi:hypothetical protein